MLDKITGMRVFVAAVQMGSFVAAADKMGMSPQMVARHIATLEKQLATRLLSRTTRKHSLTSTGSQYFRRCLTILQAIDDAENEASGTAEVPAGTIRVNAPVTFGRYALVNFLTQFIEDYPHINIELTLADDVINPSVAGFDAVIRIGDLDKNLRLVAKPLVAYRLIACASPEYLIKNGRPHHPTELQHHQCIGFSPWQEAGSTHLWPFASQDGQSNIEVSSRLTVNDWGAMLEAALKGAGVLIGYEKALHPLLHSGRLVALLAEYNIPEQAMHLLYDASRAREKRCNVFFNALCEYFRE